jgi:uncharacterized protein (DUF2062 family)
VPRKYFRKYLPHPDAVLANRWAAPFRRWLGHPNLWHLNRRSVPGAVAIGLFAGLVPGPLQMLTALLIAIPFRKNVPVALIMTLYTNPFTIVPLYLLAYEYGKLLLPGVHAPPAVPFEFSWSNLAESMRTLFAWMAALGKPLALGLVALASTLAVLGYIAAKCAWRAWVVAEWRARARRRRAAA